MNFPKYNTIQQFYRDIPIALIVRRDYSHKEAKRFTINGTNQNVWIPNKHLKEDGTLIPGQDLDYVFRAHGHQLDIAGITWAIPGIKRTMENSRFAQRRGNDD